MIRNGFDKILYQKHLERLNNIKSIIDNKEPNHLSFSKKWEEEYNRKINRINYSNTLLVNRLVNLSSNIDNKLNKHVNEVLNFKNKMILHKRKMEKIRITNENILFEKRLESITSSIKI
jgi:transposase